MFFFLKPFPKEWRWKLILFGDKSRNGRSCINQHQVSILHSTLPFCLYFCLVWLVSRFGVFPYAFYITKWKKENKVITKPKMLCIRDHPKAKNPKYFLGVWASQAGLGRWETKPSHLSLSFSKHNHTLLLALSLHHPSNPHLTDDDFFSLIW